MQIASLVRYHYAGDPIYAASHPLDGELLTDWYETIMEVDNALKDVDDTISWGLNTAAYHGESDVPERPPTDDKIQGN